LSTRDTVAVETSAILATSTIDIVGLVVVVALLPAFAIGGQSLSSGQRQAMIRRSITNFHVAFASRPAERIRQGIPAYSYAAVRKN
jgi:hypothetical protein